MIEKCGFKPVSYLSDTQLISSGELLPFSFFKRSSPKSFHKLELWLQPQVTRAIEKGDVLLVPFGVGVGVR